MHRVCHILRVFNYIKFTQRYYASYKTPNYYEILGVTSNASKKEIRNAFLTLSKQMHPDLSKKDGHTDFVKITEAYNVLSKESSREEYDSRLQYRNHYYHPQMHYYRPYRTVYQYRSSKFEEWRDDFKREGSKNGPYRVYDYEEYCNEGGKPLSKATIVLLCIVVSAFGLGLQILAIAKSPTFDRNKLLERSQIYATEQQKIRQQVMLLSKEESIDAFKKKIQKNNIVDNSND